MRMDQIGNYLTLSDQQLLEIFLVLPEIFEFTAMSSHAALRYIFPRRAVSSCVHDRLTISFLTFELAFSRRWRSFEKVGEIGLRIRSIDS